MKKIFEIPELEVVRFVEADIVVCSDCHNEWECSCYSHGEIFCNDQGGEYDESEGPLEDCNAEAYYSCLIDNSSDPYTSHYTG